MLSNIDLDHLCTHYSVPLKGIFLRDQLPSRPEMGLTIVNLDRAFDSDGPIGTHWCAVWCDPSACVYFDSYGALPPTDVDAWLKAKYRRFGHNAWIIQNIQSEVCGFYCLAFGIWMNRSRAVGESIPDCANRFVNLFGEKGNEAILRKFLLSLKNPHPLVVNKCK